MRIVVSDGSCLSDLRKASLLDAFLKIPYEILIPCTLFEDEHLNLSDAQKRELRVGGLDVIDQPGKSVLRAQQIVRFNPKLTVHDGFAFALAESYHGSVLLVPDGPLRVLATTHNIKAQGVLWVVDEIHSNGVSTPIALYEGLRLLAENPTVRLPQTELTAYVERYNSLR